VPTGIDLDRLYGRFLERYTADPARRSTVHEGVVPALRALAARGTRLGVCTNKAQAPTEPNLGAPNDVSAPAMVTARQAFDCRPFELMGGSTAREETAKRDTEGSPDRAPQANGLMLKSRHFKS
jgi:hypothetical protein